MLRFRWPGLGALVLLVMLQARALAEESALAQVPAGSPFVMQMHGFQRTQDRLVATLRNVDEQLASKVKSQLEQYVKQGFDGRTLKGVMPDRTIFFVLTGLPDPNESTPQFAAVVPVSNYQEFRDGILKEKERQALKSESAGYQSAKLDNGQAILFVQRPGYAVVTQRKEVAEKFARKFDGLKLTGELAHKLLDPDLGIYVDMAAVNQKFGDQIKQFRQSDISAWQKRFPFLSKTAPFLTALASGFLQGIADSRSFVEGIEFRPEGVAVHVEAEVNGDTASDRFLKHFQVASLRDIEELPARQMMYGGFRATPEALKALVQLRQAQPNTERSNLVPEKMIEALAAAGPRWVVGDMNYPPRGLRVWNFEHPDQASAAVLKAFQEIAAGENFGGLPLKGKMEIDANARTFHGFHLHEVRLNWDLHKMAGKDMAKEENQSHRTAERQREEALRRVLGDGVTVWFGSDGENFFEVWGQHWRSARRELDHYLDGRWALSDSPSYQNVRKQLPDQATFFTLIDVPRYLREVVRPFVGEQGCATDRHHAAHAHFTHGRFGHFTHGRFGHGDFAAMWGRPSYVGLAVALQPEHARFDCWLPTTTMRSVYHLAEPMFRTTNQK